ncbi:MAG: hypothetical protein ABIP48_16650 [Planctomycetota bacterium]
MILKDVYERFAKKAPVSVMVRATIENVLAADRLDAIFEENARQQRAGDLLFSTVADIMGLVVCQIHPSVYAAYVERRVAQTFFPERARASCWTCSEKRQGDSLWFGSCTSESLSCHQGAAVLGYRTRKGPRSRVDRFLGS